MIKEQKNLKAIKIQKNKREKLGQLTTCYSKLENGLA